VDIWSRFVVGVGEEEGQKRHLVDNDVSESPSFASSVVGLELISRPLMLCATAVRSFRIRASSSFLCGCVTSSGLLSNAPNSCSVRTGRSDIRFLRL